MAQTLAGKADYLKEVREQYEHYPYPPRDLAREKMEFHYMPQDALDCMNYYHFSGKRDFTKGFRALTAGGGTGDAAIMLAEQCRDFAADIVYLDISEASMQIAQARAKIRGLTNITWVYGSILDAPKLVEGTFDYIECGGVLHHLASPDAGLAALASLLKDDGVMGLMLYARYGRESVYQMQKLMRILNKGEDNMQRRIDNCKTILARLPASNSFKQQERTFSIDMKAFGDVGLYDLLLHSHDVAYSVPELYAFLAGAGLTLVHFFPQDARGNDLYRPEAYLGDGSMSPILDRLSLEEKQAAAELMHGKMIKHDFYAAKSVMPLPDADNLDNVPSLCMAMQKSLYGDIAAALDMVAAGQEAILNIYGKEIKLVKTPHAAQIFKAMDGHKSLRDIFKEVRAPYAANEKKPAIEPLKKEFRDIFSAFNRMEWMFLRDQSLPAIITAPEIQGRLA